ncbi:MAG: cytochrome c5 [Cocleimonas sp.]|jgi:cytochrome c5
MTKTLTTNLLGIALIALTNGAFAADEAGKKTYDQACAACHANGIAGSPKTGDLVAWAPRVAKGIDTLYASAINGKGAMPAKGGQTAIPDTDIKAAVDYMVTISSKL